MNPGLLLLFATFNLYLIMRAGIASALSGWIVISTARKGRGYLCLGFVVASTGATAWALLLIHSKYQQGRVDQLALRTSSHRGSFFHNCHLWCWILLGWMHSPNWLISYSHLQRDNNLARLSLSWQPSPQTSISGWLVWRRTHYWCCQRWCFRFEYHSGSMR